MPKIYCFVDSFYLMCMSTPLSMHHFANTHKQKLGQCIPQYTNKFIFGFGSSTYECIYNQNLSIPYATDIATMRQKNTLEYPYLFN